MYQFYGAANDNRLEEELAMLNRMTDSRDPINGYIQAYTQGNPFYTDTTMSGGGRTASNFGNLSKAVAWENLRKKQAARDWNRMPMVQQGMRQPMGVMAPPVVSSQPQSTWDFQRHKPFNDMLDQELDYRDALFEQGEDFNRRRMENQLQFRGSSGAPAQQVAPQYNFAPPVARQTAEPDPIAAQIAQENFFAGRPVNTVVPPAQRDPNQSATLDSLSAGRIRWNDTYQGYMPTNPAHWPEANSANERLKGGREYRFTPEAVQGYQRDRYDQNQRVQSRTQLGETIARGVYDSTSQLSTARQALQQATTALETARQAANARAANATQNVVYDSTIGSYVRVSADKNRTKLGLAEEVNKPISDAQKALQAAQAEFAKAESAARSIAERASGYGFSAHLERGEVLDPNNNNRVFYGDPSKQPAPAPPPWQVNQPIAAPRRQILSKLPPTDTERLATEQRRARWMDDYGYDPQSRSAMEMKRRLSGTVDPTAGVYAFKGPKVDPITGQVTYDPMAQESVAAWRAKLQQKNPGLSENALNILAINERNRYLEEIRRIQQENNISEQEAIELFGRFGGTRSKFRRQAYFSPR